MRAGDRWLFRDSDLAVPRGECLAVVGHNGSGKPTLRRCRYGTEQAAEGSVRVAGEPPNGRSVGRRYGTVLLAMIGKRIRAQVRATGTGGRPTVTLNR